MIAGLKKIRADVIQYENPEEAEEDGLLENLRRRTLPSEERDRGLVRLWEITRGRMPQHSRQLDGREESPPTPPTKSAVIQQTASKAQVSPSTVERAIRREKERQEPPAPPMPEPSLFRAPEEVRKSAPGAVRRAKALKAMAVLLRKVDGLLEDIHPDMPAIPWGRIKGELVRTQAAVWDASVAEGREDEPEPTEPHGRLVKALLGGTRIVEDSPPKPRKKRLRIEDDGGNPLIAVGYTKPADDYPEGRVDEAAPDVDDKDFPF